MRLLRLMLVGLSLIGCGGDDAATGSPGGGSGGSGGSGDASLDSRPSDSDGSPGPGDSASAAKAGFIGVVSYATEVATVFTNSVGGGFYDGPGNSIGKGCHRDVVGLCAVLLCDFTNGGDQAPPTGALQSAGTITIGGTEPTFSLAYDAGTMQYGATPMVPTDKLLFAGGSTITFAAAGGAVPAFTESVVAPTPLTVTSPALPSGTLSIDTSKDLVFNWTGTSVGRVAFNVRTITLGDAMTLAISFVSCQFDDSALTGTIPTALLQKLTKTDATTTATLTTDLSSTKEAVVGDHMVHLAVGSAITMADGKTPYKAAQVTIF